MLLDMMRPDIAALTFQGCVWYECLDAKIDVETESSILSTIQNDIVDGDGFYSKCGTCKHFFATVGSSLGYGFLDTVQVDIVHSAILGCIFVGHFVIFTPTLSSNLHLAISEDIAQHVSASAIFDGFHRD